MHQSDAEDESRRQEETSDVISASSGQCVRLRLREVVSVFFLFYDQIIGIIYKIVKYMSRYDNVVHILLLDEFCFVL